MKLTNKYGLPEAFFQAVLNDKYSRGDADYSATDLINAPRIVHLKRRHDAEIEEDVSERVWSLFGRAVHSVLESADVKNAIQEERIHADLLGRTVSGASDLYEASGKISDYKTTSVFTAMYGSRTKEWTEQLNIYGWLFRTIGFEVNALEIVVMYKDYRASEAKRMSDYPPAPVETIAIELWPLEKQQAYIEERLQLMIDNEEVSDDELPECSTEETWEKAPKWAVMKTGNQKASKVCDSEEEANAWIASQKKPEQFTFDYRAPARTRCESYCPASAFCSQFAAWKAEHEPTAKAA